MDDKGKVVGVKDPAQSPEVGVQGHLLEVAGKGLSIWLLQLISPFPIFALVAIHLHANLTFPRV